MKVVVVGLGRLGSPMAALFAASGLEVVGVDIEESRVSAVHAGRAPVSEPRLEEMLRKGRSQLTGTTDFTRALASAALTFVVVPTPSETNGIFSLKYVITAVQSIGSALKLLKNRRHVVVITSTVMPGSTMGPIREALEASAGMIVGQDVGLCYSPEFIALGSVVDDLQRPDMILLGESDTESGDVLLSALRTIVRTETPVARMHPTSAEVAKLAVNTFVTTKISYANMLAEICERLPAADALRVTAAVGLDSRIGSKYLRPGAPYGGPCFPRDNAALAAFARSLGVRADIAEATDAINRRQVDRVITVINAHTRVGDKVAILGLSYKAGTPVYEASFGINLAARCVAQGLDVLAWDPLCTDGAAPHLPGVRLCQSLAESMSQADVAVVATPWPELEQLPALLSNRDKSIVLLDCWRLFDGLTIDGNVAILQLGNHQQSTAAIAREYIKL